MLSSLVRFPFAPPTTPGNSLGNQPPAHRARSSRLPLQRTFDQRGIEVPEQPTATNTRTNHNRIATALTAFIVLASIVFVLPANAARKALVIGNDSYTAIDKLRNARADADAMAVALRKAGYVVTLEKDRTLREMKDALRAFRAGIGAGAEVVVFYSGHGVQLGAMNYLLPIDVRSQAEDQVRDDSVALDDLLGEIAKQRPALTMAIIDACRNNPFPKKGRAIGGRGLTGVAGATGQMVIYSAGEGQEALDRLSDKDPVRNGVFTRVFVREMEKPGIPISEIVRNVREEVHRLAADVRHQQVPAIYDQVLGRFYFYGPGSTPAVATAPPQSPSTAADGGAVELAFWNSIASSKDPLEFAAYLQSYPDGSFAALARLKQKQLQPEAATPATLPASISRSKPAIVVFSGDSAGEATARTYFGEDVVLNRFNMGELIQKDVLELLRWKFPDVRVEGSDHQGDATRIRISVNNIVFRNNASGQGFDATGKLSIVVSTSPMAPSIERSFDLAAHGNDTVFMFLRSHTTMSNDMLAQLPALLKHDILSKARLALEDPEIRRLAGPVNN